mgnify:CR=1 FL=1
MSTFGGQIAALTGSGLLNTFGDNPLVSVLFGGNDLFAALDDPTFDAAALARGLGDGIRAIADLGEEYDSFVVSSVGDLTAAPSFGEASRLAALATGDPEVIAAQQALAARAQQISLAYQTELELEIARLVDEGLDITFFDQAQIFADGLRDGSLSFAESIFPCTPQMSAPDLVNNCAVLGFDESGAPIVDISVADNFLWVDGVHPSQAVHQFLAAELRAVLGDRVPAPVPLPAGLPLLLLGIGALVLIRRRGLF